MEFWLNPATTMEGRCVLVEVKKKGVGRKKGWRVLFITRFMA